MSEIGNNFQENVYCQISKSNFIVLTYCFWQDCYCPAGQYESAQYPIQCVQCEVGSYCPENDDKQYECPMSKYSSPGSKTISDCRDPVCGNGILEVDEDCDDGEQFNGDGCNGFCQFEDSCACAAGNLYICTDEGLFSTSSCCPSRVNPVTNEFVCNCNGIVSEHNGYIISENTCEKIDINECLQNHGNCAENAICQNFDSVANNGTKTHECICPAGLVGDGINRCDVFVYTTSYQLQLYNVLQQQITNIDSLKNAILQTDFFGKTNILAKDLDIKIVVGNLVQRRRLLTEDTVDAIITVTVFSDSQLEMEQTTQDVDSEQVQEFIQDFYNISNVDLIQEPQNVITSADQVYGSINTVLSGFEIESVVYEPILFAW